MEEGGGAGEVGGGAAVGGEFGESGNGIGIKYLMWNEIGRVLMTGSESKHPNGSWLSTRGKFEPQT